jgi:hypothetical protein
MIEWDLCLFPWCLSCAHLWYILFFHRCYGILWDFLIFGLFWLVADLLFLVGWLIFPFLIGWLDFPFMVGLFYSTTFGRYFVYMSIVYFVY